MQSQLVSSHGMLAILEVLEGRAARDVNYKLLQIVNVVRLITNPLLNSLFILLNIAGHRGYGLLGELLPHWVCFGCRVILTRHLTLFPSGIPVIMNFTSKKHPSECRLEASKFIQLLCHASVLTLQMFIS